MVTTLELHCDLCTEVRAFTQPTCEDHPTPDCAEWSCTTCGAAILISPVIMLKDRATPVELATRRRPRSTPARRAA